MCAILFLRICSKICVSVLGPLYPTAFFAPFALRIYVFNVNAISISCYTLHYVCLWNVILVICMAIQLIWFDLILWCHKLYCSQIFYTPPLQQSWRGVILVSPCLSVRLSVCGQNRVRAVCSTILDGSISYLHILSSNFRCVACNVHYKIQTFEILANSLNL